MRQLFYGIVYIAVFIAGGMYAKCPVFHPAHKCKPAGAIPCPCDRATCNPDAPHCPCGSKGCTCQ